MDPSMRNREWVDSLSVVDSGHASSSLLARAEAQDIDAWNRLVELFGPLVYGWSRKLGVPACDTPDICQDVFGAVWHSLGGFDRRGDDTTFRRWLWMITRNKSMDYFRRATGEQRGVGGSTHMRILSEMPQFPDEQDRKDFHSDTWHIVQTTLDFIRADFTEHVWSAFWNTSVLGQTATDVATELEMTPNAVRQGKFRVMSRLRSELDGLVS